MAGLVIYSPIQRKHPPNINTQQRLYGIQLSRILSQSPLNKSDLVLRKTKHPGYIRLIEPIDISGCSKGLSYI